MTNQITKIEMNWLSIDGLKFGYEERYLCRENGEIFAGRLMPYDGWVDQIYDDRARAYKELARGEARNERLLW